MSGRVFRLGHYTYTTAGKQDFPLLRVDVGAVAHRSRQVRRALPKRTRLGVVLKKTEPIAALGRELERVGGVDYLVGVARSDPRTFCMLLVKLLPAELKVEAGDSGGPLVVIRVYTGGRGGG